MVAIRNSVCWFVVQSGLLLWEVAATCLVGVAFAMAIMSLGIAVLGWEPNCLRGNIRTWGQRKAVVGFHVTPGKSIVADAVMSLATTASELSRQLESWHCNLRSLWDSQAESGKSSVSVNAAVDAVANG